MSSDCLGRRSRALILGQTLPGIALLLVAGPVPAAEGWETQPGSKPNRLPPFTQTSYPASNETTRPAPFTSQTIPDKRQRYTVTITLLPNGPQIVHAPIGVLTAHVPEDAQIWFNDRLMKSKGTLRYFETPPLTPGKHYSYTVRVVWRQNGHATSKTEQVRIEAGEMHTLYLNPREMKSGIAAHLEP